MIINSTANKIPFCNLDFINFPIISKIQQIFSSQNIKYFI